ncbi:Rid family hydrolase [Glutamicibacter sp.]|uniref:RidA family protein n=1 Tax=Glutamicibacter sp. TaxID=1931995 RepID=UPI0028BE3F54|nr:Rid family hydrolase [Glutamicibacter sp.]
MKNTTNYHFSQTLFASSAPFPHFVRHGELGFTAGIIGQDRKHGQLVSDDVEQQCEAMMGNLGALQEELNLNFTHVVKTTIYLRSYEDFETINRVYGSCFAAPYPVRTTLAVAALPLDAGVQIDAVLDLSHNGGTAPWVHYFPLDALVEV